MEKIVLFQINSECQISICLILVAKFISVIFIVHMTVVAHHLLIFFVKDGDRLRIKFFPHMLSKIADLPSDVSTTSRWTCPLKILL